jgi:hypothetical protein
MKIRAVAAFAQWAVTWMPRITPVVDCVDVPDFIPVANGGDNHHTNHHHNNDWSLNVVRMFAVWNITAHRKAPDTEWASRTDKLGVGITLSTKAFRINCRALQPSSNDDGEPSRVWLMRCCYSPSRCEVNVSCLASLSFISSLNVLKCIFSVFSQRSADMFWLTIRNNF